MTEIPRWMYTLRFLPLLERVVMGNHWFRLMAGKIEKATIHSAAFDVFYAGTNPLIVTDKPVLIPLGVFTMFDPKMVCIMKEKSGLALKGLELKAGVIDADYRDEWKVVARFPHQRDGAGMTFDTNFIIKPGMKVAQFLMIELPDVALSADSKAEIIIQDQERKGGFGSTGA